MELPPIHRSITTMRLPTDLLSDLSDIARRRGMSRTKLVERALIVLVESEHARKKPREDDPFG